MSLSFAAAFPLQDLTGSYGGLLIATHSGLDIQSCGADFGLEGPAFGACAGCMTNSGRLAYRAAPALRFGGVREAAQKGTDGSWREVHEFARFLDLKVRVGHILDKVFVPGTLGLSRARFLSGATGSVNSTDNLCGLAVDYAVGDSGLVGPGYLRRNTDLLDPMHRADVEVAIDSVSLRAGIGF